jgi:hypothetical protein
MTAPARRPRGIRRIAALGGACALAILTLSSCLSVNADVTIDSDANASGTFAFALQKQAANFMGVSDLASFETLISSGEVTGGGVDEFQDCTTSETDTDFVYTCTFENQAFTATDGLWTIAKQGDSVVFHVYSKAQDGTQASDASALLGDASLGDVTVKVTFPGPITSITGDGAEKTSDTTATVTGTMTKNIDVTITSDTSSSLPIATILVVLVAIAVVVLLIVVVIVLIMRRRNPQDLTPADVVAAEALADQLPPPTEVDVLATEAPAAVVVEDVPVVEDTVVVEADVPVVEDTVVVEADVPVVAADVPIVEDTVVVEADVPVVAADVVEDATVVEPPATDEPNRD